ncbi:hypothetical protein LLG10_05165 [bacterium]|nr:hypothetical protein [bacterium]
MKLQLHFFYKILLLFALFICAFSTQKTVTLIVGTSFYSSSSHYRTLYDLSKHAPFPFSKLQTARIIPQQKLYEGLTIQWNEPLNEP